MMKSKILTSCLYRAGSVRLLDLFWGPTRLTVIAHHRIIDVNRPDFLYYEAIAESPDAFARQMTYVAENFNVIDLATLHAFIKHGHVLPSRPLLITFDDGYLDNYTNAFPVLRRLGLPAVIFLITDRMDNPIPPWWDECAYYFRHTEKLQVMLPLLGEQDISTAKQRQVVLEMLLNKLKTVPDADKQEMIPPVSSALDVAPPAHDHSLFVSWDQVREMVANGIACQSHTVSHPILTRVSQEQMRQQLKESRDRIISETGQEVIAFAYPNGLGADYDVTTQQTLSSLGYSMAFTVATGPIKAEQVYKHPMTIPRIMGRPNDSFEGFLLRVNGLLWLKKRLRSLRSFNN